MRLTSLAFGLLTLLATGAGCKKQDSSPSQSPNGGGSGTVGYCVAPYGRIVNGECVPNEGYVPVGKSFLLESDSPFIASAPQSGMDSIVANLDLSRPEVQSDGSIQYRLMMSSYRSVDSLGIGFLHDLYVSKYTRMPDGGGDSVKFEFIGNNLKTQTGIIHYYGRMNKTNDTIRGYVSYRLTSIAYPVMWYKLRRK